MKRSSVCVLVSGGLDSCVLVAELAKRYRRVFPVYIRQGLVWERAELAHLRRYLRALTAAELRRGAPAAPPKDSAAGIFPLTILDLPVRDLYRQHWSTTGRRAPGARTSDAAVELPGRNLLLLAKAAVLCKLRKIPVIALGTLAGNPFPDATPEFFRQFSRLAGVKVIAPFRQLTKAQVVRRGRHLPLHLSFSCLAPRRGRACGRCNKCAERQRALREAGIADTTRYAIGRTRRAG